MTYIAFLTSGTFEGPDIIRPSVNEASAPQIEHANWTAYWFLRYLGRAE